MLSYRKDQKKTRKALKKAWKAFENILPQFLGIIILVGILMSVFNADLISRVIGNSSGWLGVSLSSSCRGNNFNPRFHSLSNSQAIS